jgi:methylthioribose-1-phosphate isomerase
VAIHEEDVAANRSMGAHGGKLLPDGASVLTHCNAGALATAGYGTALGVIRGAVAAGKRIHVYVDETRPFLQGARLTAWELMKDRIPCTLITDNMAASLFRKGKIGAAVVGADRIARNGDVANKIGTYSLAVLAAHHRLPFLVAAPWSTVDPATPTGASIPIEERDSDEVVRVGPVRIAPEGVAARYPAFDVTPAALVTAIVTERGVLRPPLADAVAAAARAR